MLEKPATFRWLESVTKRWPEMKILVTGATVHPKSEPPRDDVYVQAMNESINPMYVDPDWSLKTRGRETYQAIDGTTPHLYKVALPNMVLTPNLRHHREHANILRLMLGMDMVDKVPPPKSNDGWNR